MIIRDSILVEFEGRKDADFAELGREGGFSKGFPLIVALMRRGEDDERDTGINRQRKWEVLVTSVTQFLAVVTKATIYP